MKLLVLKENFKKGLDIVGRIANKSFSLPILNNVLLTGGKNLVCLTTTDLEVGINYWILSKIEEQGKITVPAKFLTSFISSLPKEKILLEKKDNTLFVECKNFKTNIKGLSADDFPIIPKIEKQIFIETLAQPFCRGLSQVVDNTASSQTRPEISGIYLLFEKDKITMAATDSFRLAEKKLFYKKDLIKPDFEQKSIILPQKAAREIISIVSEQDKKIKIYFSANQVMFEVPAEEFDGPKLQLVSRLIEGDYPNYQEIIPDKYKTQLVLSKEEFLSHLKTASLFSGRINEVKLEVVPQSSELTIFGESQEVGKSRSRLSGKIKGEKTEISFNWRFLIDGVASCSSSEIILELNGQDGPAVLRPVGEPNFIYIAMPIKSA